MSGDTSFAKIDRTSLLVLALYLVTALLYLWPLPLHWTSHIPGDNGDSYPNFWPFWYFPHALISASSLFFHHMQLYPHGMQLVYVTASPVGGVLMSPITMLVSTAAALNTWLLLHLWFGGWFFFRFCRELNCSPGAAWLGGFAYQWSPFIAVHLPGHYTLVQVGYTAAALYFLLRLARLRGPWRDVIGPAFGLGIACGALSITDFYLTMMTAFLLLMVLVHIALDRDLRAALYQKIFWLGIAVASLLAVIIVTPWIIEMVHLRNRHEYPPPNPRLVAKLTLTWRRLMSPPGYHGVWQENIYGDQDKPVSMYNEWAYLGAIGFFVAAVGLLYLKPWRQAALWAMAFFVVLGLGSGNRYSDTTGIFSFGKLWPAFFPFSEFRVSSRWQFALCVIVAIALALGVNALFHVKLKRLAVKQIFLFSVTALMAFDLMRWPLPICPATPINSGIPVRAATDGARTVLDVPVGIVSGQGHQMGIIDNENLRRQLHHQRPLVYGNISRLPKDVYETYLADAELQAFFRAQGPADDVETTSVESLDWPAFRQRYDISGTRIPLDWPTSSALQQIINDTAPGQWQWDETQGALIGELKSSESAK